MNNILKTDATQVIYKITFNVQFKNIPYFEELFLSDALCISSQELFSSTIHSQDDDLWSLEILVAHMPDMLAISTHIMDYIHQHHLNFDPKLALEQITDQDWVQVYQQQLQPIHIGRFIITSKHTKPDYAQNHNILYIEHSRAFGTGEHATTALCIKMLESLAHYPITSVVDIGTGSGILSFVAERIWPESKVTGCDIDLISINIAQENAVHNKSLVHFYHSEAVNLQPVDHSSDELCPTVTTPIDQTKKTKFDLVVSNITANALIDMVQVITASIHLNSKVILSGFLDYQVEAIIQVYNAHGFQLEQQLHQDQWYGLLFSVGMQSKS